MSECNSSVIPYICGKNALYVSMEECETCTPTRISIIVPPTKLVYNDGELIDITGIVVKAYCEDGTEWGTVPFNELDYDPKVATLQEWGKRSDLDLGGGLEQPIRFNNNSFTYGSGEFGSVIPWYTRTVSGTALAVFGHFVDNEPMGRVRIIRASAQPTEAIDTDINNVTGDIRTSELPCSEPFTHNGKTVYFGSGVSLHGDTKSHSHNGIVTAPYSDLHKVQNIAWTMIYGDDVQTEETVTVKWEYEVGEVLTDTYEAIVRG